MKNYLVVSALGENRPGLISELSRVISECDCCILNSRMAVLGNELAVILMVQGNWNALAKLELQWKRLEPSLNMIIFSKRTGERKYRGNILPYAVEVVSINHASIVYNLTNFFVNHSVTIEDLTIYSYQTAHSDTRMFSVNLTIGIPADTHIASLREEFMDFCDELNLDAVMEPIKG